MKRTIRQYRNRAAFTIVELLTVMSIIIILIGLLVPSLNMVKRYAKKVKQRAQFHSIDIAMELFQTEWDGYPDSSYTLTPNGYGGAQKLCESMMGQDLLGFHPDSLFRSDGKDSGGNLLYGLSQANPLYVDNLRARRGPYLHLESANVYKMGQIYANVGPFNKESFVLCDVYSNVTHRETGKKIGMPILYYKASKNNTSHDVNDPDKAENIYNYKDNDELTKLAVPWDATAQHPMFTDKKVFYRNTRNYSITTSLRPHKADSYILISAGLDGLYGTADDIFNFGTD